MASWFDRFTGKDVKALPALIVPGRYAANEVFLVNGHTTLQPGDLLVSDGSDKLQEATFIKSAHLLDDVTEQGFIEQALFTYHQQMEETGEAGFLLPETLLSQLELLPFDQAIAEVLSKGHLQEIARKPRTELVYQQHLLPISRAKRLSSSAHRHLAAHSECWQSRTFNGIIPKSVLALESEDQLDIYENRVYAKLLDHLEVYLARRCRDVKKLADLYDKFEREVQNKNQSSLYYQLRENICQLWGEGFSGSADTVDAMAANSSTTINVLGRLLKTVRQLKQSSVYLQCGRGSIIRSKINLTNVLLHDPHYRHVTRLWHDWVDCSVKAKQTPADIYQRNQSRTKDYLEYCQGLVKRALNELGFEQQAQTFVRGSFEIKISISRQAEIILQSSKQQLTVVTDSSYLSLTQQGNTGLDSSRVLLSLRQNEDGLTVCPIYFYTLEVIVLYLAKWIVRQNIDVLGFKKDRLPGTFLNLFKSVKTDAWVIEGKRITFNKPFAAVLSQINKHRGKVDPAIVRSLAEFDKQANHFEQLLYCPACGQKANEQQWLAREQRCFAIVNSQCEHQWEVRRDTSGHRQLVVKPVNSSTADGFENLARHDWQLTLENGDKQP